MQHRAFVSGLAAILLCAAGLSACLTPHAKPTPSAAILESRAGAKAHAAACAPGGLEAISPLDADFAFDDAEISPLGLTRLTAAVRWLGCNPGVEVVIRPDADNHGDKAHLDAMAASRAKAVADKLRDLGATAATLRIVARGAPDPVSAPHLVIIAAGRGW
jgi:outer membrane protein OmpA-like peptidoglycan-associated protein